ncbi:MAG TPA: hypothetical protein VFO85_09005 [Vicinamibacteria bacterium]|nr:hypothetical protein [Vicinamibacteria bacterium]
MDAPEERVPLFGTWGRIYAAALVCAAAVITAIAVFSAWRY